MEKKGQLDVFRKLSDLIREEKNIEAQILLQNIDSNHLVDKSNITLLHVASENGNEVMTEYLLDKQLIDINSQDENGKTPIMLSVKERNNERTVEILLGFKPDIHIRDNFGKSTLQMVFEIGLTRLKFIERFVTIVKMENDDIEIIALKLIHMGCPLYYAMIFKNSEITKIMLKNGCPINARDFETGKTPLHVAVQLKDLKNVKLLIEYGADVNAVDLHGEIPFLYVYENSYEELEILKILVQQGPLLTSLNDFGSFPISAVSLMGKRETLLILLNSNIDNDARDGHQNTPISYYLGNGDLSLENADVFESIRSKTFDVNATNVNGNSLLFWAASTGSCKMVQLLLDRGAKTNVFNVRNYSPLYLACTYPYETSRHKKCVELLLEHKADLQIVTVYGKTILDIIAENKNYYAIEPICGQLAILVNRGTQVSNLILDQIEAHQLFKDQFELCKRQLEDLKSNVIHASMTLYTILDESKKAIALYARNNDFYLGLSKFNNKYSTNSYYCHLLRSHLEDPMKYASSRREMVNTLCEIMELSYYSNHIVIDKIIGYIMNEFS